MYEEIVLIIAAASTLAILSYLYRENIFYRIAEYTMIGISAGYLFVMAYRNIISFGLNPIVQKQDYTYIIAFVLGFMMFGIYVKKYNWISRWPMAFIIAVGTGISLRGLVISQLLAQIKATTIDISTPLKTFNSVFTLIVVVCVLSYFIFSREQKGVLGITGKTGRYAMMVAFGTVVTFMFMTTTTVIIGRLKVAVLPYPAYYIAIISLILIAIDVIRKRIR